MKPSSRPGEILLTALAAPFGVARATSDPLDLVNAVFSWGGMDGWRSWMPLGVAGIIVWSLWIYRWVLSRAYRPVVNRYVTTTSVVVPSFREDVAILHRCLGTWLAQNPSELIIVPDVEDVECLRMLNQVTDPRVPVIR